MNAPPAPDAVRVDIWLWAARMYKTRSLAKAAIAAGRVEVNEAVCKPSRALRVGDRIVLTRAGERYALRVAGLSEQRGPAAAAQALYAEDEASVAARLAERERRRLAGAGYAAPPARPDKRARRSIIRLQDEA
jgi:ribosome-associated heat shock protein Hsp15